MGESTSDGYDGSISSYILRQVGQVQHQMLNDGRKLEALVAASQTSPLAGMRWTLATRLRCRRNHSLSCFKVPVNC